MDIITFQSPFSRCDNVQVLISKDRRCHDHACSLATIALRLLLLRGTRVRVHAEEIFSLLKLDGGISADQILRRGRPGYVRGL
jgi:hypothetical protein